MGQRGRKEKMLAPHELKNKAFSKSLKGYNAAEVDDYIEFLIGKYTEAYRENNELDRKLRVVVNNLDEIKDEEESIRSTLISARKMGEKIIRDANERADIITGAIKERCDAIIADFKDQLQNEKEEMWTIRTRILDFKKDVFELYRKQIEELQNLSVNEIEDIVLPNEDAIVSKIFTDVKGTIETELKKSADAEPQMADDPASTVERATVSGQKLTEADVIAQLIPDDSKADNTEKNVKSEEDEYLRLMQEDNKNKTE
jgi:DivIVA domain-containing protein